MDELLAARLEGMKIPISAPPADASPALRHAFKVARQDQIARRPLKHATLDGLSSALQAELRVKPALQGTLLNELHEEFDRLASYALALRENSYLRALTERRTRFPIDLKMLGPTRMANISELYRNYAIACYKLDTELFWLHLQKIAAADERFRPMLEEAKTKLDVSVAMTVICGLAAVVWAPLLALRGSTVGLFLIVAVLLPGATLILYQTSVVNLRVFGETLRAAVDLFRFQLLQALHIELPKDSDTEQQIWEQITHRSQVLSKSKLEYAHPK
jgi:hypothetical protein